MKSLKLSIDQMNKKLFTYFRNYFKYNFIISSLIIKTFKSENWKIAMHFLHEDNQIIKILDLDT